jgi:hypothetical protein
MWRLSYHYSTPRDYDHYDDNHYDDNHYDYYNDDRTSLRLQ